MARWSSVWRPSAWDIEHHGNSQLLVSHWVLLNQEPRDDPKVPDCLAIVCRALPGSKQIPMAAHLDMVHFEAFSSHMACSSYMWVTGWDPNMNQVMIQRSQTLWECLVVTTRFWAKFHSCTARVCCGSLQLICGSTSYFRAHWMGSLFILSFSPHPSTKESQGPHESWLST